MSDFGSGKAEGFSWLRGGGITGEIIRSKGWSKTPVGPIETWPQTLTTALSICLLSKQPSFVWWKSGEDSLTIFYYDAYIPIAAAKHPEQIGVDPRSPKGWAEMWPCREVGRSTRRDDLIERRGIDHARAGAPLNGGVLEGGNCVACVRCIPVFAPDCTRKEMP